MDLRGLSFAALFCGLVVVVVGCEAGVVVAAMVVGLSVESSSGSGGTNRPPRVLPTNTDLEGGGSGGGRGAVTTRGTAPCKAPRRTDTSGNNRKVRRLT